MIGLMRLKVNKRRLVQVLLWIIILYSISLLINNPLTAKEYEISNYDIEMKLTDVGDYLVTETIRYNFVEGSFSWASRDIPGKGFSALEFLSLKGRETEVSDYQVEEGNELKVKWEFPETERPATFILKYRAVAGLTSLNGRNVIDWNPVGSDWDVPIRDLDIKITLPRSMENIEIEPRSDLIANNHNQIISFHYDSLPPGTYYHLKITFPEYIDMTSRRKPSPGDRFIPHVIGGLILGIIVIVLTIIRGIKKRPSPELVNLKPGTLSLAELATVYYSAGTEEKRGVTAEIFSLARQGKIKLISQLKKGSFGSKSSIVKVEVISEKDLSITEKIIIEGLKKAGDLKKFARDYGLFKKVSQQVREGLQEKGLISGKAVARRRRILYSSILFGLSGGILLTIGLVASIPPVVGLAVFVLIFAFGRLISGAMISLLSGQGRYLQQESADYLEEKKEILDRLAAKDQAVEALEYFFAEIEYLILHRKFNAYSFNKYKKVFKKADSFTIPDWLELDLSELNTTLDALEVVDVVNYVLISTVFVTASTGTTATGTGAGGSGAGGGGGAAG